MSRSSCPVCLLAALLPALLSAAEGPALLRFTLRNELPHARRLEPVRCGLPLPRGFAPSADGLALQQADGTGLAVQISTASSYEDGTPRWVLLDFQADLPAASTVGYQLVRGPRAAVPRPIACALEEGVARIDTGAAMFRIDTGHFRLLDSVRIGNVELLAQDAASGWLLEVEGGVQYAPQEAMAEARFEELGPLTAVLLVRGTFGHQTGPPLADYVCRLQFYAGKSELRVQYTLRNPAAHRHPGNSWDLGSGGSLSMEDFSLVLPLAAGSWVPQVAVAAGQPPVLATRLYQDSSGGPHWNSANHVDKQLRLPTRFRGYRLFEGPRQVAAGERALGWLHARGEAGGLAVSVREFWQNFPKAYQCEENRLRVGLWPREFSIPHELLGGEQKTHELLLLGHAAETTDQMVQQRMDAFHHPLYAMPDPAVLWETRAFWPSGPLDRARFGMLERTCDHFLEPAEPGGASVTTKWEQIDEFGWRHFGDTFADNELSPEALVRDFPEHHFGRQPISHFGNEYDVAYTVWLQGLRRADPRWMWLADVLCRHYADICVYHSDAEPSAAYRHGPFTHTTHDTPALRSTHRMYPSETSRYGLRYASGGPNAGHCYVASLAQHYYLTGDRVSREAFLEVAGWAVDSPWFREMMMGDARGIGNLLLTHVDAYQLTREPRYYEAAVHMLDYVREPFSGLGGTLFAKAAGRFLDMKIENGLQDDDYRRARDKLLRFGDLYLTLPDDQPHRYLEQTCFHGEVLATCYLHAPPDHPQREAYFQKAHALMEHAQSRWPGGYRPTKTLTMCFANTGAYFRALQLRAGQATDVNDSADRP